VCSLHLSPVSFVWSSTSLSCAPVPTDVNYGLGSPKCVRDAVSFLSHECSSVSVFVLVAVWSCFSCLVLLGGGATAGKLGHMSCSGIALHNGTCGGGRHVKILGIWRNISSRCSPREIHTYIFFFSYQYTCRPQLSSPSLRLMPGPDVVLMTCFLHYNICSRFVFNRRF
jgi:hypothetical protein